MRIKAVQLVETFWRLILIEFFWEIDYIYYIPSNVLYSFKNYITYIIFPSNSCSFNVLVSHKGSLK